MEGYVHIWSQGTRYSCRSCQACGWRGMQIMNRQSVYHETRNSCNVKLSKLTKVLASSVPPHHGGTKSRSTYRHQGLHFVSRRRQPCNRHQVPEDNLIPLHTAETQTRNR
jgi:hypothetical protein